MFVMRLCASAALCMMCGASFILLLIAEGSLCTKNRYTHLQSSVPYALRPSDWGVRLLAQKARQPKHDVWNDGAPSTDTSTSETFWRRSFGASKGSHSMKGYTKRDNMADGHVCAKSAKLVLGKTGDRLSGPILLLYCVGTGTHGWARGQCVRMRFGHGCAAPNMLRSPRVNILRFLVDSDGDCWFPARLRASQARWLCCGADSIWLQRFPRHDLGGARAAHLRFGCWSC